MFDLREESVMQPIGSTFHVKAEPSGAGLVKRWFVVAVCIGQERTTLKRLEEMGIETHFAQSVVARALGVRRKVRDVYSPLFRGYLFVRLPSPVDLNTWIGINHTKGVIRLLATTSGPSPLDEGFVEELIAHGPVRQTEAGKRRLRLGDLARVTNGLFTSIVGKIVAATPRGRVRILIQMLNAPREIELPVSILELESAAPRRR